MATQNKTSPHFPVLLTEPCGDLGVYNETKQTKEEKNERCTGYRNFRNLSEEL